MVVEAPRPLAGPREKNQRTVRRTIQRQVVRRRAAVVYRSPILDVLDMVDRCLREVLDPSRTEAVVQILVPFVPEVGAFEEGDLTGLELWHTGVAPEPLPSEYRRHLER